MAFKTFIFALVIVSAAAQHQNVAHSHAQITLNKASTHRDTLHETPVHHNIETKYTPSQNQYYSSSNGQNNGQHVSYSQSSQSSHEFGAHVVPIVKQVVPIVKQVVPIAHYAKPLSQNSHSTSSVSQSHSAPLTKVALAAPVAHYSSPVAHYSSPVAHYSSPVAHYSSPVAQYSSPVAHYSAPAAHYSTPAQVHYATPVAKLAYATPVAKYVAAPSYHHEEEEYGPAEYSFEYSVHDEHTGDIKSQKETRHGDQVQGSYMLIEPDGSRRIVEYTSDKHTGFNAVVHREETKHTVAPVKAAIVAPVAVKYAVPIHSYHH